MLIALEGCDGVGKSTVAERLVGALSLSGEVEVLHKGPMTADAITEYELPLEDYAPGSGRHVICDRWSLGELVYGPLLRGESRVSEAERRHIDRFLAARGCVMAHVTAPQHLIRRRLTERGDDLIKLEHVSHIVNAYHDLFTTLPQVTYAAQLALNGDDDHDRPLLQALVHTAAAVEAGAYQLTRFRTYVGGTSPGVLLLGERRNSPTDRPDPHRAAFTPYPSTSGAFLLSALPHDLASTAGLANACEEDVVALYEVLGEPRVVALGRAAALECERAEVPYGQVPHPQWVRRFANSRLTDYGLAIREAAYHGVDLSHVFVD